MKINRTLFPRKRSVISLIIGFIITFNVIMFTISIDVRGQEATSPWIIQPFSAQWIDNSQFENATGWSSTINGDSSDLSVNILNSTANYNITGNKGNLTLVETPDSGGWVRIKNDDNMTLPDNFDANSFGWYADHFWDNQVNQSIKVQWQKNFTIAEDMSDYNITSASLEAWINATVTAEPLDDKGIDIPGDTKLKPSSSNTIWYALGDFAAFYVELSNLDKSRNFEALYYRTTDLGKDGNDTLGIDPITELNDTKIEPQDEDTLRFYLNEVLKKDNHNFSLTLGIYLWCEDNGYPGDSDSWDALWIKNLSLSITYEKVINRYSTASWEYQGDQIDSKGGILNILGATLFFDAKVNDTLIGNISQNSELRVYLNDKIYEERVKLSQLQEGLISIKQNGFDLTDLVSLSKNEPLKVKIELYIADEFDLDAIYEISIDNVKLDINYNLLFFNPTISEQESVLPIILTILVLAIIGGLTGYYIYYRMVLRFPKSVRKLRKYRKSLKKSKAPKIEVSSRKKAFSSKLDELKRTPLSDSIKNLAKTTKGKIKASEKAIKKKSLILLIFLIFMIFGFPFFSISAVASQDSIPKLNILQNQIISSQAGGTQLVRGTFQQQWIQNSGFSSSTNWFSTIEADAFDVNNIIGNGMANYSINGEEETFIVHSGTPTNTSAPYWYNSTNFRVNAYPTMGFGLNESGFYAHHYWDEHSGSIYNADQRVSVQWEKIITMPQNMADYNITAASLEVTVNATVKEEEGYASDTYGGYGGIDVYGDFVPGYGWSIGEGDFVKFYVMLANSDKTYNFTVATYLNKTLGSDSRPGAANDTDFLYDTIFSPENMQDLIFYINQVLKDTNQNFTLVLGMEFNCEDNFTTDIDEFVNVLIKSCDFNITYRRVINQFSKASWTYRGNQFRTGGPIIAEIIQANLNFAYKTNRTIPFDLTSNSEFKILINGIEHTETINLNNAPLSFQTARTGGFDVTNLIPYNEDINVTIQVVLADEFGLNETITLSIDDVSLVIGYNLYTIRPISRVTVSPIFTAAFIGLVAAAVAFGAYFIYYLKVLRFPEPIRKLRKYRNSLKKNKVPRNISVIRREQAFKKKMRV